MQKIEKDIKVTRYVAIDGTEFETEAECLHYEGSAFGQLIEQLKDCIRHHCSRECGWQYYHLVPKTRHDIFVIGQILKMAGNDEPCAEIYDHLSLLAVKLQCNVVVAAEVANLEDYIAEVTNGEYALVSTIKTGEVKC